MSLPEIFPKITLDKGDINPGIRLFGRRFVNQQTIPELASEFLAVAFSPKWLDKEKFDQALPSMQQLQSWTDETLRYKPEIRLNLKLFALLGNSRVDGRHEVHRIQYEKLTEEMKTRISVNNGNPDEVLECLEEFPSGFQGAGFNRVWCAQSFFPISPGLINQETIWRDSAGRRHPEITWDSSLEEFRVFYDRTKRDFMARGGELLYLQICNSLRQDISVIKSFANELVLKEDEKDTKILINSITSGLDKVKHNYTKSIESLINFIEGLDTRTKARTNLESFDIECEWCPVEAWPEGYLFAVELNRLLHARIDPTERIELMMTGCALQVLRSLCAQAVRYADLPVRDGWGGVLHYAWIFSTADSTGQQRKASHRSLQFIQSMIQKALRHKDLEENAWQSIKPTASALYKEADTKYGHKFFLSLGKKLEVIIPYRGPGARFIMTDRLLRYLVAVLLPPGERCTYEDFLHRLYQHYGIAVEGEYLNDAATWTGLPTNSSIQPENGSSLKGMLRAGSFLTDLSDAYSIVRNPFGDEE